MSEIVSLLENTGAPRHLIDSCKLTNFLDLVARGWLLSNKSITVAVFDEDDPHAAAVERALDAQAAATESASPGRGAPKALDVGALEQKQMSELLEMLEAAGTPSEQIDACFDADSPKQAAISLLRRADADGGAASEAASDPAESNDRNACGADEVEIETDRCERVADVVQEKVDESTFTYVQGVPMLLKPFDDKLQRLVPWLKGYVLQREKDWLALPVAQTWDPEVRAARPRAAAKRPGPNQRVAPAHRTPA